MGPSMDDSIAATPTTSSLAAPRRASRRLAHVTTTPFSAMASKSTPSISTSLREDSTRRRSSRSTSKRPRSKGACLASLSDLDHDSNDSMSSLSDEETDRRVEDKLNGLCFIADTAGGLCTMALGDEAAGDDGQHIDDGSTSEVSHSTGDLAVEIEELNVALAN